MTVYGGVNDVAMVLGLSASTVKKYYLAIEEHGYRFRRNQQGNVMFGEHDLELFRKLVVTKNQPGVTIKQAVEMITADLTDLTVRTSDDHQPNVDLTVMTEQMNELKEMLAVVQNELKTIKAEQQSSRRLLEAQQDEPSIKEVMSETNRMFKEVLDQMAASKEEKKGFWSRLFK